MRSASSVNGSTRKVGVLPPSPTSCATGCSAVSGTGASRSRSCTTRSVRSRCRIRCCRSSSPTSRTSSPQHLMIRTRCRSRRWRARRLGRGRARASRTRLGGIRRRRPAHLRARNQHDAAVGGVVLVLPALSRSDQRGAVGRPGRRAVRGRKGPGNGLPKSGSSTSTLAVSNMRCSICSTPASGTKCSTTSVTSRLVEPFQRLVNQGYILAAAFTDEPAACTSRPRTWSSATAGASTMMRPFPASSARWARASRTSVTPDDIFDEYGADTLRLYEMSIGPLDASRPWNTSDIVGVHRFFQRLWRNVDRREYGRGPCLRSSA